MAVLVAAAYPFHPSCSALLRFVLVPKAVEREGEVSEAGLLVGVALAAVAAPGGV